MKAVVSITIDEEFVVHDIKVIEGEKGLFIAMPSRKATDGEYRDIAHPINSSTREIPGSCSRGRSCGIRSKEVFTTPHFMESFMKCGVFFCKNIPVICPNYFTIYCA